MSKDKTSYAEEIEKNAKTFGFKSANLMFLNKTLSSFSDKSLNVEIPAFYPCAHQVILQHLNDYSPEPNGWQSQYRLFQKSFEVQKDKNALSGETEKILEDLQLIIAQCFSEHPIETNDILDALKIKANEENDQTLLMVRSTGINEDKVDMANPGGNESLLSNVKNLSASIGRVAASYVGKKSILQRIKAGDMTITEWPVFPVLIQKLAGEAPHFEKIDRDNDNEYISGVMYTHHGAVRIQSAPGHGEYVVNSMGPTDNYYLSENAVCYSEISPKKYRLAPKFNNSENRLNLTWVKNGTDNQYSSSLPNEILPQCQLIANQIEKTYQMRMDIEFVYHKPTHTLSIVQARPIPEGSRSLSEPSAVAPSYLIQPKDIQNQTQAKQVITPELNTAAVISYGSEVIICKDIKDALDHYLGSATEQKAIKAVIVENPAPDTSHEAGQFNLSNIPVLRVDKIALLIEAREKGNILWVVDPQHSSVYELNPELKKNTMNKSITDILYETGILQKGIFASTLSSRVSLQSYNFSQTSSAVFTPMHHASRLIKKSNYRYGKLINMAETGDVVTQNQLFSFLYKQIYPSNKIEKDQVAHITSYESLKKSLTKLLIPRIGLKSHETQAALSQCLKIVINAKKRGLISNTLFKNMMIVSGEVALLLNEIENPKFKLKNKLEQDKLLLEYFNIQNKLYGLFLERNSKETLSDSFISNLSNNQHIKQTQKRLNSEGSSLDKLTETQRLQFYELVKLDRMTSNQNLKETWLKFCFEICHSDEKLNRLSKLVVDLVHLDVQDAWFNLFFHEASKNHPNDYNKLFEVLLEQFEHISIDEIEIGTRQIIEMEAQVEQWAQYNNYPKLMKALTERIPTLRETFKFMDGQSPLERLIIIKNTKRLIDVMDKSIKALAYSRDYAENETEYSIKAARFRALIEQFNHLMDPWLQIAYPHEALQINNFRNQFKKTIEQTKSKDKFPVTKSSNFDVREATLVDTQGSGIRKRATLDACQSLEDCFSCVHQNFMAAIDQIESQQQLTVGRLAYPPLLAKFEEALLSLKGQVIHGHAMPISNPINHLSNSNLSHIIYHIPLSVHNAVVTVAHSPKTGKCYLKYHTGSPFSEDISRWRIIQNKAKFDIAFNSLEKGRNFPTPHTKHNRYSAEFCLEINEDSISNILPIIKNAIADTFKWSAIKPEDEKRLENLDSWNKEQLVTHKDVALNLILNGYFIHNPYFSKNISHRIKQLHLLVMLKKQEDYFSFDEAPIEIIITSEKYRNMKTLLNDTPRESLKEVFHTIFLDPSITNKLWEELTGFDKVSFFEKFIFDQNNDSASICNLIFSEELIAKSHGIQELKKRIEQLPNSNQQSSASYSRKRKL